MEREEILTIYKNGPEAVIMEVKNMACKLWKNILSDKTRNRMADVLLTGLGLKVRGIVTCSY